MLTTLARIETTLKETNSKIDAAQKETNSKIDATQKETYSNFKETNRTLTILIVAFSVLFTMNGMVNMPQLVALFK
jgi:hypothetical protein